jgi:peptidoglycan/xylan/chitin deacetylase (PgdA/CDA1 family)
MQTRIFLAALLALIPAHAFAHSPEEEANEIREARLAEIRDRLSVFKLPFSALGEGTAVTPPPGTPPVTPPVTPTPPVPVCKYVSNIASPPPAMKVALTFDDGPGAATPAILETLAKYQAPATFFQIGINALANPPLVERVYNTYNMIIGNHSWDHPDFHTLTPEAQADQVNRNISLLGGFQTPKFFRYPYGNSTCETNELVHSLGYKIVGWHVDSCDWAYNKTGIVSDKDAAICEVQTANRANFRGHVVERLLARKGGILLMHEIQPNTIKQLDQLLEELVHEGFTFTTLTDPGFRSALK